jgi:hypothetical protein
MAMTISFQDFADADGITAKFKMSSRSLCRLQALYEAWCSAVAPEWRRRFVQAQRVGGNINIKLDDGSVLEIRLQRRDASGKAVRT